MKLGNSHNSCKQKFRQLEVLEPHISEPYNFSVYKSQLQDAAIFRQILNNSAEKDQSNILHLLGIY